MDHQAFELLKDSIDELRKDVKEIKSDLVKSKYPKPQEE